MKTLSPSIRPFLFSIFFLSFTISANSQAFQWAKSSGGNGADVGMAVTVGPNNSFYVTGFFSTTAYFDNTALTSVGNYDVFIAKYFDDGTLQWIQQAGGGGNDIANDIASDASGNVYVTGYYTGSAIFGNDTLIGNGNKEIFIAKYNSSGNCLWATSAGGASEDESNSICIDASGNAYVIGYFRDAATFGSYSLPGYGGSDIFIAKCDADGVWQWAEKAGNCDWDYGMGICIDGSGNLFITGNYGNCWNLPAHFGAIDLSTNGGSEIFVAKLDNSGNFLWARHAGGSAGDLGSDITTDASGNCYATGYFQGTATFESQSLTSDGVDDYYIAKYDPSGNLAWIRQVGGTGYFKSNGISINNSNFVYLTGTFDNTAVFGDTTLTSAGYDNVFILKYDVSGNFYWAKQAKGSYYHIVQDVNNANADVYITGNLNANAWFDCFFTSSVAGTGDVFIAKLNDYITTSKNISGSPFCTGNSIDIPFTTSYNFDPSNVFTAQLSDQTGCFDNPVILGTLSGTTSGTINGTIPKTVTSGTTYRVRVVSSSPYIIGTDNNVNLTINSVVAEAGNDITINPGDSVLIGSSPIAGFTYSWSPTTGLNNPSIANPIANPATCTTYYLIVNDDNGCIAQDSIKIKLSNIKTDFCLLNMYINSISVPVGSNYPICSGDIINITAEGYGGYDGHGCQDPPGNYFTYNWSDGSSGAIINVSPNVTTTYSVTASANAPYCSCTITGDITITVNPLPSADVGPDQIICLGNSITLSAPGGGASYIWSNGYSTQSISVSPTVTTIYTVTVTNGYGCSASDNITVSVSGNAPTISAGPMQEICQPGDCVIINTTASGGVQGYSYSWSSNPLGFTSTLEDPQVCPTTTTIYYVTVTDAAGCTASDNVKVELFSPYITQNITSPCSGNQHMLFVQGVTYPSSSFNWSDGQSGNIIYVYPTTTTTYTVTVTSGICSTSLEVTIGVLPDNLSCDISIESYCQEDATFIALTNIDPSDYSYYTFYWDFGDGTTYSIIGDPNASHIYNNPGYYLITLTTTNSFYCGQSSCTNQQIVSIIPSNAGYNSSCCSDGQPYNQDGDFIAQSGTWTYGVANNNPWDATSPVLVKGIIRIPAGINVTIKNMTFEFDPNSKVIIEREGSLTLDDGAILKGLSSCGTMWQGIEVWGNSSYRHFLPVIGLPGSPPVPDTYGQSKQGKLIIKNSSIIKDAHIGVLLGRTYICIPFSLNTLCKKLPYLLSYDGGILDANNAVFENNGVAVKILPFHPSTSSGFANYNATKIINSTINGGNLLDPGYSIGNPYGYEYPTTNIFCPQYANANAYTPLGHAVTGIYQWNVKYVTIDNNVFGNTSTNNLIEGIKSFDAPYNVSASLFDNLDYGIRIFNTSPSLLGHTISDNKYSNGDGFKNISNFSVQVEGSKFDNIINNTFNDPGYTSSFGQTGILLNNSSNFSINDNNFYKIDHGIDCYGSGTGGGSIASKTIADGNYFSECPLDIMTWGLNPKLQIHCNTSNNNYLSFYGGSNWENYGIFVDQGFKDLSTEARGPAGNAFWPLSDDRKIINNNLFHFVSYPFPHFIYPYYTYYRHGGTTGSERIPAPSSATLPLPQYYSKQYYINDESHKYESSTSCKPCLTPLCNTAKIYSDSIKIATLQAEYNSVLNNIDKGQTQQLLTAINSSMSEGNLKNKLVNASPLSDTVLIAAINRTNQLSPGNFKNVILLNSPTSDKVRYELDKKTASLPPGIAKQINTAQANTEPYRTLTAISREINSVKSEYQLNLNNYVQRLMDNDSLDKALSVMDRQAENETKQILFGTFLIDSNIVEAQSRLNNYVPAIEEETDWKTMNTLLLNYSLESKTVFEMSSTEEVYIRSLANNNSGSPASIQAQAILRLVYGEEFDLPPLDINNLKIEDEESSIIGDTSDFLGNNIPNPFNNSTLIPYHLPDSTSKAYLNIFDITGKKIMAVDLSVNENIISISLENYEQGVYLYSLMVNGYPIQTKRMVLIK